MNKKPKRRRTDVGAFTSFYEAEEKSFDIIRDFGSESGYGLWNQETNSSIDALSLKSLFYTEDWVYILVSKYASRIAGQRLKVMRKGESPKPEPLHPVQQVLDNPNPRQDYYQWMYCLVCDLTLLGNGLTWKTGNQLLYIPAETVNIRFEKTTPILYEVIKYNDAQNASLGYMPIAKIPFEQMAHIKRPNPGSVYWGLSPFIAGSKSVLFNRYSSEFLNNYYIKGAQPGMIIEMLEGANEKEALRLLRGMELSYTGRKNQRRNMVLPRGVKATQAQGSLADQQLKDYIDKNRENIMNLLEVPKHELSLAMSGSIGSEEYKTALRQFWRGPLRSTMDSIVGVLNKQFAQELGAGFEIAFDLSDIEALQDDEHKKALLAKELLSTHTINEVRAKLYKMEPTANGDSVGTQSAAPAFFAAPPVTETTNEPTIEQKRFVALEANMKLFAEYKSKDPKWWQEREQSLQKEFDRASKSVRSNFLDVLGSQILAVLPIVKSAVKIEKDVYSKVRLKKQITAALDKFEADYTNGNLKALEATMDVGYDSMLKVPFNLPNTDQIAAVKQRNAAKRKQLLEDRQVEIFSQVNATTADKILTRIDEGISNKETIQEIAKGIQERLTEAGSVSSRAETIARTETLTASSIGQAAVMEDVSKVVPNLKKMWVNAGDDRVRGNPGGLYPESKADHWVLQGEVKSYDKKFSNGLMFPRDPGGQAHDVVNCRCSFIMIPAEDADKLGLQDIDSNVE